MSSLSNAVPLQQGILVIASSSVPSSVSSGTAETQLASIVVAAGLMGLNGRLRVTTTWSCTNSGNNKVLRVRFGGAAGVPYLATTVTTVQTARSQVEIGNANSASSQRGWSNITAFGTSTANSIGTSSIDTTAATTIYISGQPSSSGETITLESYLVEFVPGI